MKTMKYISPSKSLAIFTAILAVSLLTSKAFALNEACYWCEDESKYESQGYSCEYYCRNGQSTSINNTCNSGYILCTKGTGTRYTANYLSLSEPQYTIGLQGIEQTTVDTKSLSWNNSPFIYLYNPPQGLISVKLNSKLNRYISKPGFNTTNGWNVVGDTKTGSFTLDGKKQNSLFYELNLDSITINRHGRNFANKEELLSYLETSIFFKQLGFSDVEKKNSLTYVRTRLDQDNKGTKNYYLTILPDDVVSHISTLTVTPEPKKLIRTYFAIYSSNVPVTTEGDFLFPNNAKATDAFTVKETGEFFLTSDMVVFFK
jgi:hypothetical protein